MNLFIKFYSTCIITTYLFWVGVIEIDDLLLIFSNENTTDKLMIGWITNTNYVKSMYEHKIKN